MASVTAKTELMDNAFPAGQLKLSGSFFVVEDQKGEHMIFSADKRGKLCLILKGEAGHNELLNLSDQFKVPQDHRVKALAVSQNRDGIVNLAFATGKEGGTDTLFVLRPKKPLREDWTRPFDHAVDVVSGDQMDVYIKDIMMGTSNDSDDDTTTYPQIYLTFRSPDKVTDDIWALTVNLEQGQWRNEKIFQMPCDPDQIVDKCVGNLPLYRGLFVLFKERHESPYADQLRFVGFNPTKSNPTLASIVQKVPEGASRIASFDNSDGKTDLIISGSKELVWRSAQQCFKGSTSPFTVLSANPMVTGLAQLRLAQSKELCAIWCLNKDCLLAYQEFCIDQEDAEQPPLERAPVIPLMDSESQSDRFAALEHLALGQKLFVISKDGVIKLVEQDVETLIWKDPIDVMIPDSDEMIEFKSHTIRINVADKSTADPLPDFPLRLCCSTAQELLVNGICVRGSLEGHAVKTDEAGILTVIAKSDGIAAPIFTLHDVNPNPAKPLANGKFVIDPMDKVWVKVRAIKTPQDLKAIQLPDGTPLVRSDATDTELKQAADALVKLAGVQNEITNPSPALPPPPPPTPPPQRPRGFRGFLWGAFKWVCKKIKQGVEWVVRKVKEAWEFVVEIAGKVWNFVLETVQQVATAVQQVLQAVGKGFKKILEVFEFLFAWGDVIDVKNCFVNVTTQGLLWGVDAVGMFEEQVDSFFEDLKEKARRLKRAKVPPNLAGRKAGNDPEIQAEAKSAKNSDITSDTMDSPAASYGSYHLNHSGKAAPKPVASEGQSSIDRLLRRLKGVWAAIEQLITRCGTNIGNLFKSRDVTIDSILQTVGVDLLDDTINVVQQIVVGLIGSLADLILELTDGINQEITIPVLSPLYKSLTGSKLTILDAVCLVLAIPASFLYKAITGKKPKDLPNIGDLIRPDAMKDELDKRMGRQRTESPNVTTSGDVQIEMAAISTSTSGAAKPKPSADKAAAAKQWQTKFCQSLSTISQILKFGLPAGSWLFYTCYSWPKQFIPEGPFNPKKVLIGAAVKLVMWLGSFVSVISFSPKAFINGVYDINKCWDDVWFPHRLRMWLMGGISVAGALGGKWVGCAFSIVGGVIQSGLLLFHHIESAVSGAGYSVYLAIEEWAKMSGKLASAVSGLTCGGGGVVAGVALFLTTSGDFMNIIRVGLEMDGKREVLLTGVNLD